MGDVLSSAGKPHYVVYLFWPGFALCTMASVVAERDSNLEGVDRQEKMCGLGFGGTKRRKRKFIPDFTDMGCWRWLMHKGKWRVFPIRKKTPY